MSRGPGAAGRIRHLERLLDNTWKIADYWKVRALRAEGHDLPARQHPGLTLRDSIPARDADREPADTVVSGSDARAVTSGDAGAPSASHATVGQASAGSGGVTPGDESS